MNLPGQNLLIRRCFQEAILLSSALIKHTINAAAADMRTSSASSPSTAQAKVLFDTAKHLEAHRRNLSAEFCEKFEWHLQLAISVLEENDVSSLGRDGLLKISQKQALVDPNTQDLSKQLQQIITPLTETRLQALDSHISGAMGLSTTRAFINPFRPEVLCNALAELLKNNPSYFQQHSAAELSFIARPYAGGLKRLYIDLVGIMSQHDASAQLKNNSQHNGQIQADHYSETRPIPLAETAAEPSTTESSTPTNGFSIGTSNGIWITRDTTIKTEFPSMQHLARVFPSVAREEVQAFLYDPNWKNLDAPLPPSYFEAIEKTRQRFVKAAATTKAPSNQSLTEFHDARRKQSPVERVPIILDLGHWLAGSDWGRWRSPAVRGEDIVKLKLEAQHVSEVMAIDSVNMTLSQLASNTSLLWPVREAFLALSSSLVTLATLDPWFLALDAHPVRSWIDAVINKSYTFNDEYSEAFELFMQSLTAEVQHLQHVDARMADEWALAFSMSLSKLQTFWDSSSPQRNSLHALQTQQFIQDRQTLAHQLAVSWSENDVLKKSPKPISKFILDQWTQVLAHAQLTNKQLLDDPGGFNEAASDLLWSLSGEAAISDPVHALSVLPTALLKLREGLRLIGTQENQIKETLDMMMPYHRRLLEMRRRKLRREARLQGADASVGEVKHSDAQDTPIELVDLSFESTAPSTLSTPLVNNHERAAVDIDLADSGNASLNDLGEDSDMTDLHSLDDKPSRPVPKRMNDASSKTEQQLARIREGDWFDMLTHNEWQRVQLVWCNDTRSLFMFESQNGSPHSMTKRSCMKLMQSDHLRPIQNDAKSARHMSSMFGAPDF